MQKMGNVEKGSNLSNGAWIYGMLGECYTPFVAMPFKRKRHFKLSCQVGAL